MYTANSLANSILRGFGREFNMPMDTFMQSQLDMYQEVSIDYGYGSLDPNKTLNYARNTI